MMMDSEEEEEQTALVCDNGKFIQEILLVLPLKNLFQIFLAFRDHTKTLIEFAESTFDL